MFVESWKLKVESWKLKVESWVAFKMPSFLPSLCQTRYNVMPASPFNNFQSFQTCIGFVKVRHWEIKQGIWFLFLLDNNALLDAILGSPNYNINNFLIIKNNNYLAVLSNIRWLLLLLLFLTCTVYALALRTKKIIHYS